MTKVVVVPHLSRHLAMGTGKCGMASRPAIPQAVQELRPDRAVGAEGRNQGQERAKKSQACLHGTILSLIRLSDSPGPEGALV